MTSPLRSRMGAATTASMPRVDGLHPDTSIAGPNRRGDRHLGALARLQLAARQADDLPGALVGELKPPVGERLDFDMLARNGRFLERGNDDTRDVARGIMPG